MNSSFIDELQKIAISASQMRKVIRRLAPVTKHRAEGEQLKKLYRLLTKSPTSLEVPLKTRLEVFKHWKRTGKLPGLESEGKGLALSSFSPEAKYVRSTEPVRFFSGGSREGLGAAAKEPRSLLDHLYLLPGSTRAQRLGLYGGPLPVAASYAGRRGGTGAIAEMVAPSKSVVRLGPRELIVPHGHQAELVKFVKPPPPQEVPPSGILKTLMERAK